MFKWDSESHNTKNEKIIHHARTHKILCTKSINRMKWEMLELAKKISEHKNASISNCEHSWNKWKIEKLRKAVEDKRKNQMEIF
jgi:hypothetical protein